MAIKNAKLEAAKKIAAKVKSKAKKPIAKKTPTKAPTTFSGRQNNPYREELDADKLAKRVGYRWTDEGANKVGKNPRNRPTKADVEQWSEKTFKLRGDDTLHKYIYKETREDHADLKPSKRYQSLADGGTAGAGSFKKGGVATGFSGRQNNPYREELDADKLAKRVGFRWTDEGANKVGKNPRNRPTKADVEQWSEKTFKLRGDDTLHKYIYKETREDHADLKPSKRYQSLADGGTLGAGSFAKGGGVGEELMGGQPYTSKPSGYKLISSKGREIIVSDDGGKTKEKWIKNNGYDGYTLHYNGNEYEFVYSLSDGGTLGAGSFGRGGMVTKLSEAFASDDLKKELASKMKEGDDIVAFAYTDYGGDYFDKVAIEYFIENHPENIVVENTVYFGKNGIVFGKPATEFLEAAEDYLLGYEDMESFYDEMQYEQEHEDFERFLSDLAKYDNYKVSPEAIEWLNENKGGYYSMRTTGLDFSSSDLEKELLEEGLIEKEEGYAKGGSFAEGGEILSDKAKKVFDEMIRTTIDRYKVSKGIVGYVADDMGIKLTEKEKEQVLDLYISKSGIGTKGMHYADGGTLGAGSFAEGGKIDKDLKEFVKSLPQNTPTIIKNSQIKFGEVGIMYALDYIIESGETNVKSKLEHKKIMEIIEDNSLDFYKLLNDRFKNKIRFDNGGTLGAGSFKKGGDVEPNYKRDRKWVNKAEKYEVEYYREHPNRRGKKYKRTGYMGNLKFPYYADGGTLGAGSFGRGGMVTKLSEAFASDDLKKELASKIKEGDDIVAFAYTDYGGDYFDKVAIEYFIENHPENIVVENTVYGGKNGIVFGEPATEFLEAAEDYLLGYEDMESFYYEMQYEQEHEDFERFLSDLATYDNYKVSPEAIKWLNENKGGYYSMYPTGLDFSSSDLEKELLEEGLIEKEEGYANGGRMAHGGKMGMGGNMMHNNRMAHGGSMGRRMIENQYDGLEAKELWDEVWTKEQKEHFLKDHEARISEIEDSYFEEGQILKLARFKFNGLHSDVKKALKQHVKEGQYEKGGKVYAGGGFFQAFSSFKPKVQETREGFSGRQNNPYREELDGNRLAKRVGLRWTNEGAKKLGKNPRNRPTKADVAEWGNKTFKLRGDNKLHKYIYKETREDHADLKPSRRFLSFGDGGTMGAGSFAKGGKTKYTPQYVRNEDIASITLKSGKTITNDYIYDGAYVSKSLKLEDGGTTGAGSFARGGKTKYSPQYVKNEDIASMTLKSGKVITNDYIYDGAYVSKSLKLEGGGTMGAGSFARGGGVARIANVEAASNTENLIPFIGNNLEGKLLENGDYVVLSYGYYPIWWFCKAENKWYGNTTKYSMTTSKHVSQSRPTFNATMLSKNELDEKMMKHNARFEEGGNVGEVLVPTPATTQTVASATPTAS